MSKTVPASVAFLFWPLCPLHFPEHMPSWGCQFSCSVMSNSLRPHVLHQDSVQHQLPEPTQTRVYSVGDAIPPSHPLSSLSPPTFNLAQHQGLSNKSVLHIRWPKYWSLSFSISPSNEYSGLISFRMDWLDLLAVQGTKSINSSVVSFLYSPTLTCIHDYWKNHSLD